jgi:uncharacterized protein (TIGR03790 family)
VNGSIVSIKYSWSAKTVRTNRPYESMTADFLEEGATAGIGYAVEPFASGVTDSATLARNYINGFRIGELAWSTIPSLSWGAVVFGDPKAGYPVADLNLTPLYPTISNNLTCNITIIDDFHPKLNLTYEWYKNQSNQTLLGGSVPNMASGSSVIVNVTSPNLTSAATWYCRAYVYYNGELVSSKNSSNVTVIDPSALSFCTILDLPNTAYNMSANITTTGNCFTIAAENVTLNCRGYTINGGLSGTAISHSGGNNPRVENCRINGFQFGISLGASGGVVNNNTLNGTQTGIYFSSNNGIISNNSLNASSVSLYIQSASNMTALNITSTNEESEGFELSGTNNTIRSSSFSGIGGSGSVMNGAGNVLANSSISNSGYGLTLFGCTSCTVSNTNLTAYGSGPAIYMLEDASSNTISGVRAHSNSSNALLLEATFTNVFANSTFSSNSSIGIHFTYGVDNIFINNTISSNSTLVQLESSNNGNLFYHNNFTATSGTYVNDLDGGNFYNTTIGGTPAGNIYHNVINGSVPITGTVLSVFPNLYYGSSGSGYPYNDTTSLGKFSCAFPGCADYGPLTPPASGPSFFGYGDVLLVVNNNSTNSINAANYFISKRVNLTHVLNVTLPNNTVTLKFGLTNASLYTPIRNYLNGSNGTGINYIVLSMAIPLFTNETDSYITPGCSFNALTCQNASSIDSEVALLNTAYESSISLAGRVANPYYGGGRFSRATNGIYLVGRLDANNYSVVEGMINHSTWFSKTDLDTGQHLLMGLSNIYRTQFGNANLSLSSDGLAVLYNNSSAPQVPRNVSNVSYYDGFGCYNFGDCNSGSTDSRNFTYRNGSFVGSRYSWSAKGLTLDPIPWHNHNLVNYLAEGATFGLGYAVEPITDGVSNPQYMAENYLAGLSMGQSAWASVPYLSWAPTFFGDPKAAYPSISTIITPPTPTNVSNLSCNITVYDPINGYSYNITYEWYKNGVNQTSLAGSSQNVPVDTSVITNVTSGNLTVGENWVCKGYMRRGGTLYHTSNYTVNIGSVSSCTNITTSGPTYITINGFSNGTCFNIRADNVLLDCQGYTLNGTNQTNSYGIYSNRTNTTVRNCNISNFQHGIYFQNTLNSSITNTNASTTRASGYGFYFQGANRTAVSIANGTSGLSYAIYITNSVNGTIASSSFTGRQDIYYHPPALAECENTFSDLNGSAGAPIYLYRNAPASAANQAFSRIVLCNATGSNITNASFTSGFGSVASNNTTIANVTISSAFDIGFAIYSSGMVNITNLSTTSTTYGTYLRGITNITIMGFNSTKTSTTGSSSAIAVVDSNSLNMTGSYGVSERGAGITFSGISVNNRISGSYFEQNSLSGAAAIYLTENTTVQNTNASADINQLYLEGSNNVVTNLIGLSGNGFSIDGSNNRVSGTFAASTISASGENNTIHDSTINCGASNLALDIYGPRTSISDSSITCAGDYALYLQSDYNNFTRTNITETFGTYAVYTTNSYNRFVSTIISSPGTGTTPGNAVAFDGGGSGNLFANSTISSNTGTALYLSAATSNNFTNNAFISNTTLVSLDGSSSGNLFYWNTFTATGGSYISDANGGNYYNTTIGGTPAGNSWFNVLNGSVSILGAALSPFPNLYYGSTGSGYPYNSTTSLGKFSCNFGGCADYAPLTPTLISCVGATANYTCGQNVMISCTLNGNLSNKWGITDTLSPVIQATEDWERNIMDRVTVLIDANDSTKLHLWYMGGDEIGYAMSSTLDHYPVEAYYDSGIHDWGQATAGVNASASATLLNGTSYLLQYRSSSSNNSSVLAQDWSTYSTGSLSLGRYFQFRIRLRTLDPANAAVINSVTFTNGSSSWATSGSSWANGTFYNGAASDGNAISSTKNQPAFKFTKYWANPVMRLSQFMNRSAMAPGAIIQDEGLFKHWFNAVWGGSNCSGWSLGYATSPDGINWTDGNNNTCLRIYPGVAGDVDPTVIKDVDGYNIWFGHSGSNLAYSLSPNGVSNWSTPVNIYGGASNAISTVKIGSTYHHYFEVASNGWETMHGVSGTKNGSIQNATVIISRSNFNGDWRQGGAATPWMVYNGSRVWAFIKGFAGFWSTPVGFIPDIHNFTTSPNKVPTYQELAKISVSSNNIFKSTNIGIPIHGPALIKKIVVEVETPYGNASNGSTVAGDKTMQVSVGTESAAVNAQNLTGTAADILNQSNFSANTGGTIGNSNSDYFVGYLNSSLGGAYVQNPTIYYVNIIAKASSISGVNATQQVRALVTVSLEFDHYEPSTCLTVGANNVSINCNGYNISGAINSNTTTAISSSYQNTSIQNCPISGFSDGISLNSANGGSILNDTVSANSCSVNLTSSSNSFITNSTLSSDLSSAICLNGTSTTNNTISRNILSSISGTTVSISGSSYSNLFYWNNFTNTSGLYVNDSNTGQTTTCYQEQPNVDPGCVGSFAGGNWTLDGFWASSPTGTNLSSNIIDADKCTSDSSNGNDATADIYYRIPAGTTSARWNITGAICANSISFPLPSGCINASAPHYPYLHLQIVSSQDFSDSYYYCESTSGLQGIINTGSPDVFEEGVTWTYSTAKTNLFNTTIGGKGEGNLWFNVINGSVSILGGVLSDYGQLFYVGSAGAGYPYNNSTSLGKFVCSSASCADYAPLTKTQYLTCGNLSTAGTAYNMSASLSINGATCFNVTAQNVTLNCNGYTLQGNSTPNTYGVFSSQFNTTVKNCTILSFADGIRFSSANNGSLLYNTVNNSTGNGIRLSSSNFTNLTSNKACFNTYDMNNSGNSNFGSPNTCDTFTNITENGHLGCTFACSSLWQRVFGDINGTIILGTSAVSPYVFSWNSSVGTNIYFTDYDASINWMQLQAIGRNTTGQNTSNDFLMLDSAFNATSYRDNINKTYSTDGSTPVRTENYTIYGRPVNFVPVANSSPAATAFRTGILWDMADTGTQYSNITRQDTVWVVRANSTITDAYGSYEYLAQIPFTLRSYQAGNDLVSIYAELQ